MPCQWCSIRLKELGALLKKEFATTLKERASRMILVAPIVLYVILFGYIATFNLNNDTRTSTAIVTAFYLLLNSVEWDT